MSIFSLRFRKILFLFLLGLLFLPLIQSTTKLVSVAPLKGAITEAPDSLFTPARWFSGDFQKQKELFLKDIFGFRQIFIRINNQIAFDFFNMALANGVTIGKKNYVYEEDYIRAYCGLNFIGADSILHRMQKLKFVQDTLAKLNKTLIIVFAAGKGTFYPEYFPDRYKKVGPTNSEYYVKIAKQLGINHIDFNTYFAENRDKTKYLLYPKYANHWSFYGECLAADSIISYIEHARKIRMPHIFWHDIDISTPKYRDDDIEEGMNLLFTLKPDTLAYPRLQFESDSGKIKPSSLVIADSFYWGMFGYLPRVFSDNHFWYYNNEIYPDDSKSGLTTKQVNLKDELARYDVIMIMSTEATLPKAGWGFIENSYNMFKGTVSIQQDSTYIRKLKQTIQSIKNDAPWLEDMKAQAKTRGISLDSTLILNAIYVLKQQK